MNFPKEVQDLLDRASKAATAKKAATGIQPFTTSICGNDWDRVIESWATIAYSFVEQALGPYQKEPLREILAVSDGAHAAGANASFEPMTGRIRLCSSVVDGRMGTLLEKITHELLHASLNDFPEGDPFYEESYVDYSVWVMAHAPIWGSHRNEMVEAAAFNIECRRDRAFKTSTDYDRKRWAGGVFVNYAHGPWIVARLRQKKIDGDLTW